MLSKISAIWILVLYYLISNLEKDGDRADQVGLLRPEVRHPAEAVQARALVRLRHLHSPTRGEGPRDHEV